MIPNPKNPTSTSGSSGGSREVQVKSYVRNGRLVRASRRRVKSAGDAMKATAGLSAEKAKFLTALAAQMKQLGVKQSDFVQSNGEVSGKNDKAHAALVTALKKAGYTLKMNEDEGFGTATSPDGKRVIKIGIAESWDGATYFTKDGEVMDNRTRKPRDFSQPGKPGYPRKVEPK